MSDPTPRRVTRSGNSRAATTAGPLPALTTRFSTSYGSPGNPTLNSQSAAGSADDLVSAAVSTSRPSLTTATTTRASRRGRGSAAVVRQTTAVAEHDTGFHHQAEATRAFVDNTPTPAVNTSRPSTSLGIDADYTGASRATGLMLPPPRPYGPPADRPNAQAPNVVPVQTPGTVVTPNMSDSAQVAGEEARISPSEPSGAHVVFSTITRYFPELAHGANPTVRQYLMKWFSWSAIILLLFLASTGILVSMGFTYSIVPLPSAMQSFRQSWVTGQKHAFGFSTQQDVLQQLDATATQLGIASAELSRLHELRSMFEDSREQVRLQDEALSELRRVLPEVIVVEKHDGEIVLNDRFWSAFEQKVSQAADTSPLWDALLRAHSKAIEDKISSELIENVATKYEYLQVVRRAVNERIDIEVRRFEQRLSQIASTVSQRATEKYIEKYAEIFTYEDRKALEFFRGTQAGYNANQRVNFFDPSLGAMVNPYRTSSTMGKPKSSTGWMKNGLGHIDYKNLVLLQQRPPIEALTHVFDASSCWCAAPSSDKGKAQIGIKTPVPLFPESFIIEHVPVDTTLDMTTAPKTFEIWAELDSPATVQAILDDIRRADGYTNEDQCGPAPSDRAICLYQDNYSIRHFAHVQSFQLWYNTTYFGIATDFITVRIPENWGGDWTCIYRLRMHGKRADVRS